jgi:hypothetical protein
MDDAHHGGSNVTRRKQTASVIAAFTLTVGLVASSIPASAAPAGWHRIPTSWGANLRSVATGQAFTTGDKTWLAGTAYPNDGSDVNRPVVQVCSGSSCTLTHLPIQQSPYGGVAVGVSGTSDTDVWVVGALYGDDGAESVSWHWNGAKWIVVRGNDVDGEVTLTQVLSVSASESWALANNNFEDGVTGTVYHRVGTSWTEVNSFLNPGIFPDNCAEWYYNTWSDLAYVGGEPVILGVCDGTPVILKQRSATVWARIDTGLPTDVTYTHATVVNSQLWVSGQRADGSTDVERRAYGQWIAVPVTGLTGATIKSMAAGPGGTVIAVGHTGTSTEPTAASWQWNGTVWTALSTPATAGASWLSTVSIASSGYAVAAGADSTKPTKPPFLSRG